MRYGIKKKKNFKKEVHLRRLSVQFGFIPVLDCLLDISASDVCKTRCSGGYVVYGLCLAPYRIN